MDRKLSGAEAVNGFCAWLTTRDEVTTMSSKHDCGVIVDLIVKFCEANELDEPVDGWADVLTHPKSNML